MKDVLNLFNVRYLHAEKYLVGQKIVAAIYGYTINLITASPSADNRNFSIQLGQPHVSNQNKGQENK